MGQYLCANSHTKYILLYTISVVADRAADKELFRSLYDYENLVPGYTCWIKAEELDEKTICRGLGGEFLVVRNPYYRRTA